MQSPRFRRSREPAITILSPSLSPATPVPAVRSHGRVDLCVQARDDGTGIARLRTSGCLKLLFPTGRAPLTAVLLNTSGGLTGGDDLGVTLDARPGAHLALTTQAAERIYKAAQGSARVVNTITAQDRSTVMWLPQDTILFDASGLNRSLHCEVAPTATALLVEPVVFGRTLSGEALRDITYTDRIHVTRDGAPLVSDAIHISGDAQAQLARAATAGGAGAMATLIYAAPDAGNRLDALRRAIGSGGAASSPRDGVICARLLAADSFDLRRTLTRALTLLAGTDLPPSWRL
ncbi:urease accessory protein UreD [Loktanella sp. 3ANDIMAR09]|uniref:urease accessory protein UreD n=1 Tax=Loktanella sp. 3ANDIMAR09 TaxID=1225657 RepID=UPI0009F9A9DC|nr:urease accessory protein UreD [Loktanella sp. 3ANDIMAR09]